MKRLFKFCGRSSAASGMTAVYVLGTLFRSLMEKYFGSELIPTTCTSEKLKKLKLISLLKNSQGDYLINLLVFVT